MPNDIRVTPAKVINHCSHIFGVLLHSKRSW
jgi:hypothetical protein